MAKRRLAAFADAYLKHQLQMKQQAQQYEFQRQNQAALAELQGQLQKDAASQRAEESLFGRVQQSPILAQNLMNGGRNQVAGMDLEPFAQESFEPEMKQITGAQNLGQLPDAGALMAQRLSRRVPVRSLDEVRMMVEARQAQDKNLRESMAPTAVDGVNPVTGLGQKQFLPSDPRQLTGQVVPTEATPQQAGANAGQEELAKITTPGLNQAGITNKLQELNQLGPVQARNAGRQAGAVQAASTAAEISTKSRMLPILVKIESEIAQARAVGKPVQAQTGQLTQSFGQKMVDIADALNQEQGRGTARVSGMRQTVANATGLPIADDGPLIGVGGKALANENGAPMTRIDGVNQLNSLRSGLTSTMLRTLGRVGTPTEKDEERTLELFPTGGLSANENANRNANFMKLLRAAEQVGQRYPQIDPNMPIEQQLAETERRIQEALAMSQGGGVGGAIPANEILGLGAP